MVRALWILPVIGAGLGCRHALPPQATCVQIARSRSVDWTLYLFVGPTDERCGPPGNEATESSATEYFERAGWITRTCVDGKVRVALTAAGARWAKRWPVATVGERRRYAVRVGRPHVHSVEIEHTMRDFALLAWVVEYRLTAEGKALKYRASQSSFTRSLDLVYTYGRWHPKHEPRGRGLFWH